ncbi:glycerophosphodiester phosphodiesterase family protein [Paenibacillus allorhizosphaerae]|uniref:GP-PDE domain-containing protein n=1 Tax=Paenibacillus allorhizosphaerae TaxID=2849866 RepID=A0ABM8VSG0_9BACL|nr:glycerophosphodiester phosphodiesterase family protein [Paenibacillus allorhizosphaerae]CAG7656443.1 hypothetical protein PAECIP111802_06401 [Paenibacillus allorhizosphaerae]
MIKDKKLILGASFFILLGLAATSTIVNIWPKPVEASIKPIKVMLNGQELKPSDKTGLYKNGKDYVPLSILSEKTIYVPIRFAFESTGFQVNWNEENSVVNVISNQPSKSTKPFIVAGHRGYSAVAPENTMASFKAAMDNKADVLEFDVQISQDGVPVIIHDNTVDRTTSGKGEVKKLPLAQLQALDAGSKFNLRFAGEKIPTLKEVLDFAKSSTVTLYPEIKGYRTKEDIAIIMNELMSAGYEQRSVIQSFNYADFDTVRSISQKMKIALLVNNDMTQFMTALDKAVAYKNAALFVNSALLVKYPRLIDLAHLSEIDVVAWTVDDKNTASTLMDKGIDGIITNRLDLFK